jgi:hypothetical protein
MELQLGSINVFAEVEKIFNTKNNWALFGYSKGDVILKEKGEGGLEELEEEFDPSQIQYAFASCVDPTTNLPKYVFISWCGDGVPTNKKGLFQSHLPVVRSKFKGFHVEIMARSEEDVKPKVIRDKVKNASGAKYSYHDNKSGGGVKVEPKDELDNTKVVETKKAPTSLAPKPQVSVSSITQNFVGLKTSSQEKTDERARKEAEVQALIKQRKDMIAENVSGKSHLKALNEMKFNERKVEDSVPKRNVFEERNKKLEEDAMARKSKEEIERNRKREEEIEAKRMEEVKKEKMEMEERKREEEEKEERERFERERVQEEERLRMEYEQQCNKEDMSSGNQNHEQHQPDSFFSPIKALVMFDFEGTDEGDLTVFNGEIVFNVEDVHEDWYKGVVLRFNMELSGIFPKSYVQIIEDSQLIDILNKLDDMDLKKWVFDKTGIKADGWVDNVNHEDVPVLGTATALYEFTAREVNEISFTKGTLITHVEKISEGWWSGSVDGIFGVFPSNYVQLIDP